MYYKDILYNNAMQYGRQLICYSGKRPATTRNAYFLEEDYAILKIENVRGEVFEFKIDVDDLEEVKKYAWACARKYARSNRVGFLHCFIAKKTTAHNCIDHINNDTFDNRKVNLREISTWSNNLNRKDLKKIRGA